MDTYNFANLQREFVLRMSKKLAIDKDMHIVSAGVLALTII